MGTQTDWPLRPDVAASSDASLQTGDTIAHGRSEYRRAARARHQAIGLLLLGGLLCLTALAFGRWETGHGMARWWWLIAATAVSVTCLIHSHRRHRGIGADRDASPYYGLFAGVTSGAVLLTLLAVQSSVLLGVLFTMAAVLGFMAWIEQSAIGMTAALCQAVLSIGHGFASLSDGPDAGYGTLAVGLMLLAGAAAVATIEAGSESDAGAARIE
ncbi:MAG: hypothetical protein OER95_18645 [Acidimicrobiia bacterium]|nr:hypothetical protein [Acidimicrobiia bacterium]